MYVMYVIAWIIVNILMTKCGIHTKDGFYWIVQAIFVIGGFIILKEKD